MGSTGVYCLGFENKPTCIEKAGNEFYDGVTAHVLFGLEHFTQLSRPKYRLLVCKCSQQSICGRPISGSLFVEKPFLKGSTNVECLYTMLDMFSEQTAGSKLAGPKLTVGGKDSANERDTTETQLT